MTELSIKSDNIALNGRFSLGAEGKHDIHVWRSRTHNGLLMRIVGVEIGTELPETEREWPPAQIAGFFAKYQPFYDGIMPIDEVKQRHEDWLVAIKDAHNVE